MKKLLTLSLAALLALSLFACGKAATPPALGIIVADYVENVNKSDFKNITQATSDAADVTIALHTDGQTVQNVLLESGQTSGSDNHFTPEETIYQSEQLGPDDLAVIQVPFFETMPNLRLTYTGANDTVQFYVAQSGKDGSLLLIDTEE